MLCLLAVLWTGFVAYLMVSGAPNRVHIMVALTWFPPLIILPYLAWTRRLRPLGKLLSMAGVVGLGSLLMAQGISMTVKKGYLDVQLWLAYVVVLLVALATVMGLTLLCEWALTGWGRKGRDGP